MNRITTITLSVLLLFISVNILAQCADEANIYSFTFEGKTYEVVKENQNWKNATACAVERGGFLAEINSQEEQDAVFNGVLSAGINPANTIAPDGGGASYLWLGGNDIAEEGKWIWDGKNSGEGVHFFQGHYPNGQTVDNAFVNWGNEPDNWGNQDGLGLAITNWPLGVSGQWNDVADDNTLYYVIEYNPEGLGEYNSFDGIFFPNPVKDKLFFKRQPNNLSVSYNIYNAAGMLVLSDKLNTKNRGEINVESIGKGIYVLVLRYKNGETISSKFVK